MPDSADRNRSEIITVRTPRGWIDVMHQEMRGLRHGAGWEKQYLARRTGTQKWAQGASAQEAIRKAALLPAGKPPGWLRQVAAKAGMLLDGGPTSRDSAG